MKKLAKLRLTISLFAMILMLVTCLPSVTAMPLPEESHWQDMPFQERGSLPLPTLQAPPPTPPLEDELLPIPADTPQLEALREATFLLGEGDRLAAEGKTEEARQKWLEAAEAYTLADEKMGQADAYFRLAESYQVEAFFDQQKLQLTVDYYTEALLIYADIYERGVQKELDFDDQLLSQADASYNQGFALYEAGNCAQAVPHLNQARDLYREANFGGGEIRALVLIARCQIENQDFLNALTPLLEALLISQSLPLGKPASELHLEGQRQYAQGDWQGAKASFEEAHELYQEEGDEVGIAQTTLDLANVDAVLGDYPKAEEQFLLALQMFIAQADLYNQAAAHHNLGNVAVLSGRYGEAVEAYRTAIELWQRQGDPVMEVVSLNGLGNALREKGELSAALTILQGAQAIQQRLSPDAETEGDLLNNIGLVYLDQGSYQQALDFLEQGLVLRRQLPHRLKEAQGLSNIGTVQARLGRFEEALLHFQQVIDLAEEMGVPILTAKTQINIAAVQIQQGQYQKGIATFLSLEETFKQNGEHFALATIYLNVGNVYIQLGDLSEAESYLTEALRLFEEIENREGMEAANINLGVRAYRADELEAAETFLNQALSIQRQAESPNPAAMSRVLANLALVASKKGDLQAALQYAQQALPLSQEAGTLVYQGQIQITIGLIYLQMGDDLAAQDAALRGLNLAAETGDTVTEVGSLVLLANTHLARGELLKGYEYIQNAISRLEGVQGELTVAELKTTYLGQMFDGYSIAVLLAILLDRPVEAFQYAEQARARAFLDQLVNGQVDFRAGNAAPLLEREQAIKAEIAARRDQLVKLTNRSRSEWDTDTIATVQNDITTLEAEYTALLRELKIQSPEIAALISVDVAPLAEVQALLDANTTLVEYFVTEEGTLAFVITRDSLETIGLDASRQELASAIEQYLISPNLNDSHPTSLQQLRAWLIAPLTPYLTTPALHIVPHNVLHYLPFAALTDGERYLSDDYVLSTLPSASTLRFIEEKRKANANSVLALGNPVIAESLGDLRFAAQEARAIAELYGSQALIGADATESAVWSQAPAHGILHLAAHGNYNKLNPLFSTLHLASGEGHDGRLQVQELFALDLTGATDLVVLSACQTQVGEVTPGDEIVALNRAFLYAGTPTLIASLWSVDDEATSLLMEQFYTHLRSGKGKAEALRQAQIDLRTENPQYAHPYYWSAFVLTGDGGNVTNFVPHEEATATAPAPTEAPTQPVPPTETPAAPTEAPVETVAPTEVAAETVAPTEVAVEPVAPTEALVEPVAPTEALVEPVAPTEAPVEPTVAPTEVPVEAVAPTETPASPTVIPTQAASPTATAATDGEPPSGSGGNLPCLTGILLLGVVTLAGVRRGGRRKTRSR